MNFVEQDRSTFLHLGKEKCPKCGVIGNSKSVLGVDMLECPVCHSEFTEELLIIDGEDIAAGNN